MRAFKQRQKNSLIVFERGHKARGYVQIRETFREITNARERWVVLPSLSLTNSIALPLADRMHHTGPIKKERA